MLAAAVTVAPARNTVDASNLIWPHRNYWFSHRKCMKQAKNGWCICANIYMRARKKVREFPELPFLRTATTLCLTLWVNE